ncbi:MAG: gliding motility-associated C-terminal domain-containing protein [Bacteroidetes bacterium]|nr:gliding motility-associated C-terminal domain-containing protein [Bacteroidota bacterium]
MKYIYSIIFVLIAIITLNGQSVFNSGGFCFSTEEYPSSTAGFWSKSVISDFDGDGKMDFMALHFSNNDVEAYRNTGGIFPTFTLSYSNSIPSPNSFNGVDFAVGDFDGDSKPDYAIIDTSFTISIYKNISTIGTISFTNVATFVCKVPAGPQYTSPSVHLEAGDFDGNGQVDLIEMAYDQNAAIGAIGYKIKFVPNNGGFVFNTTNPVYTGFNTKSIKDFGGHFEYAMADLNGDSKKDFVVSFHDFSGNDTVSVLRNNSSVGSFALTEIKMPVTGISGNYVKRVYVKDMNADAKPDILCLFENAAGQQSIRFHYATTTPFSYSSAALNYNLPLGASCEYFEIDDLNNDGKNELIGRINWGGIALYVGKSNSVPYFDTITNTLPYSVGPQFTHIYDFNGNGYKDFIFNPGEVDGGDSQLIYISNKSYSLSISPLNPFFCSPDSVQLTATTNNTSTVTYNWSTGDTTVTNWITTSGSVSVTYSINFGTVSCYIKSDTINVAGYNPTPLTTTAVAGLVCSNAPVTLNASGAVTYTWQPGNYNGASPVVNPPANSYTVYGTDANGCKTSTTMSLNVIGAPTVAISSNTPTICQGTIAVLTASGAATYTLQPGAQTGSSFSVNPLIATTYTINGESTTGCKDDEVITINVNPAPTISANLTGTTICSGQSIGLNASGGVNYLWLPGNLIGAAQTVSPASTITYTVYGIDAIGCGNFDLVNVTVVNTPTLSVTSSSNTVCKDDMVTLNASGAGTYTWEPGGYTGASVGIYVSANTVFTVTGSLVAGCDAVDFITVNVWPSNFNAVASSTTICNGQSVTLSATGAITYTWSNGSNDSSIVVSPVTAETFMVDAIDSYGCKFVQAINVEVDPLCEITVFNGLTPNGDGKNDVFFIKNIDQYPNNMVRIFNRWGQVIFEAENYDNVNRKWNGNMYNNGVNAPAGTYYYLIDLKNGNEPLKGYIELTLK